MYNIISKIARMIANWADRKEIASKPEKYSPFRKEGVSIAHPKREIILNRIKTPDGTILISHDRHDFRSYTDANGHEYAVDGGMDYLRRLGPGDHTEMNVYEDDDFETIRTVFCRGGRGKDGKQPLKWVPMNQMSDAWLENCLTYNAALGAPYDCLPNRMYRKELTYRKEHGITIDD